MRNTASNDNGTNRPRQVLASVRDDLRERRQARRDYRVLRHELASYNTRSDVDDLLAALDNDQSTEAEQIRTILSRNLTRNLESVSRHPIAS